MTKTAIITVETFSHHSYYFMLQNDVLIKREILYLLILCGPIITARFETWDSSHYLDLISLKIIWYSQINNWNNGLITVELNVQLSK